MAYDIHPSVDEGYNFPPQVRQSIAASTEIHAAIQNESAEIVPPIVSDALASDATIRDAVIEAAEGTVREINVVRAFPEGPLDQSGKSEIPMYWVNRVLNDPLGDVVGETIEGTYSGNTLYWQNVPLLNDDLKIWQKHLPDNVVTKSTLPGLIPESTDTSEVLNYLQSRLERTINPDLPILAARLAVAKKTASALNGVFVGSSTSASNPGFIGKLSRKIQNTYIVPADSNPQWSVSSEFIERTDSGFHLYSGAQGGTRSSNYLTLEECEKIASMNPGFIMHMVGANDYRYNVPLVDYVAGLEEKLEWLDSFLTTPCQHIFVHPYPPQDKTDPVATWNEYWLAGKNVFENRTDGVCFDISSRYMPVGIPGSDPMDLLSTDEIHQTTYGYEFMADLMTNIFIK